MKKSKTKNKINKIVKKPIVVAVSGGFDPAHIGHIRNFKEAKALGNKLVVILNNDNWLKLKKGYVFMPENERKEIIESIKYVDEVVLTFHKENTDDISICKELEAIKPDIFAKGGDRVLDNIPEVAVCKKIGCKMVFNVGEGGKVQSSSWVIDRYMGEQNCFCKSGKKYKHCHGKGA
jgi:cytidyltransferase-like protein